MYEDGVIKLSKEAQRQNEIERLKRKFNNINNDTSVSYHNNHSLNSSMISLTITQNTTSFENENNPEKNSENVIKANNQINQISPANEIHLPGKLNPTPKMVDEIVKLKSAKKKISKTNSKKSSIVASNKTSKSISKIYSKCNYANKITSTNSGILHKTSIKKQEMNTNVNNPGPQMGNTNFYNSISHLTLKKENKTSNFVNKNNTNTNSSPVKLNPISHTKSSKLTIISQSVFDNSEVNQSVQDETQMTQIIQMNNIKTNKLITNELLTNNSSALENSFFINNDNLNENSLNLEKRNSADIEENQQILDIGDEHSLASENISSGHDQAIFYNKNKYIQKVKSITKFEEVKKTHTKDTEVFGLENEVDTSYNEYLRHQITNQSHSISIINTLDRDNIFYNNPSWLLSNRLINDEKNYLNRQITMNNPDYKFLEKVREDSHKAIVMKTKFFLKLDEDAMFNLLSFIFDQYVVITQINKLIQRKICLTLNSKFDRVVREFREKYSEVLELQEFYFKHNEIKKPNGYMNGVNIGYSKSSVIDLILISKIVSKLVNKCIEISFMHKTNGKEFIQTWSFDLKKKSEIGIWFASEAEENAKRIKRVCYYQPILSFYKGDFIEFKINIFSHMGVIDPTSIKWINIVSYDTPEHNFMNYEKSLVKSNVQFDKLRCCELENMIHIWKSEKLLSRKDNISEFKIIFKNNFNISDVNYDIAKFYIFKIKMRADKLGIVRKNKFVNFDIEIKPWDDHIINETQCLGLLNVNHLCSKLEIRQSTMVIFYFTDLYL